MAQLSTRLTSLLGVRHPILLAGMAGGPTTPELVGAVSAAGGLGVVGVAGMSTDAVRDAVTRARAIAGGAPVGINVLISPAVPRPGADPERVAQILAPLRAELGLPHPPPPQASCSSCSGKLTPTMPSREREKASSSNLPARSSKQQQVAA